MGFPVLGALAQWVGVGTAILIAIFPLSMFVERLFSAKLPVPNSQPSFPGVIATFLVLIFRAGLCAAASRFASSTGVPTVLSPLPLFVVIPLFEVGTASQTDS